VLFGVGLAVALIAGSRLTFASAFPYGVFRPIFHSNLLSFLVLFAATVAEVVGSVALVRGPAPEHQGININDAAFFVVGLICSSIGIWLCTTIGLQRLLV
jgi:hypothetical protein